MGQNSSSSKFSKQSSETILNPLIISAFDDLSDGKKTITYEKFIVIFRNFVICNVYFIFSIS